MPMRTTLILDDGLLERARPITGIVENTSRSFGQPHTAE
jgi:hypothetical protein